MVFVVVKQNGVAVSKEAYGGDTSNLQEQLNARKLNDKTLSFDFYDDSSVDSFNQAAIQEKPRPEKTDWQKAKTDGTSQALTFIGKKLGLE